MSKMADESFAPTGLSSSLAIVLHTVIREPGITPMELSRIMQLTPSTLTRLVEKLEHKSLVKRVVSGRNTEVFPTRQGREMQDAIKEAWKRLKDNYTQLIGESQSQKLVDAINRGIEHLQV